MPYILKINIRNLKKNFLNFVQVKFPNIQYILYEFYKNEVDLDLRKSLR